MVYGFILILRIEPNSNSRENIWNILTSVFCQLFVDKKSFSIVIMLNEIKDDFFLFQVYALKHNYIKNIVVDLIYHEIPMYGNMNTRSQFNFTYFGNRTIEYFVIWLIHSNRNTSFVFKDDKARAVISV